MALPPAGVPPRDASKESAEEDAELNFKWEELPEGSGSQQLNNPFGKRGSDFTPGDGTRLAAALQRKLQGIGDIAERELLTINRRRQLSPITVCGREVWGERPEYQPARRHGDPLTETARKMKCASQKPRRPMSRTGRPDGGMPARCSTINSTSRRSKDSAREQEPVSLRSGPHAGFGEDLRAAPQFSMCSRPCSTPREDPSRCSLMPRAPEPCRSSSRFVASTKVHDRSTPCVGGASMENPPAADVQIISDPLTLLLMYRRMLVQETNNGLMGGAPFISRPGPAGPTSADCPNSSISRQLGPWKGVSRGAWGPLMSRSM